jgi:hypothetical protein
MGVHQYPSQEQPCFRVDGYALHFEIVARDNASSASKHNQVRATTLDFYQTAAMRYRLRREIVA